MGRDASPDAFAPMPARVLVACEVHPFDEDAELHGSLGRAAQGFTRCRSSMGLVVALPHLGLVGKPWTARRAPIPHHNVHEVHPFCLPFPISQHRSTRLLRHYPRYLQLTIVQSSPAGTEASDRTEITEQSLFPWPALVLSRSLSTQSRPPYPSPSTRTAAAWAAARQLT